MVNRWCLQIIYILKYKHNTIVKIKLNFEKFYDILDRSWPSKSIIHSNTGTISTNRCWFLANDLGTRMRRDCHVIKITRQWVSTMSQILAGRRFGAIPYLWGRTYFNIIIQILNRNIVLLILLLIYNFYSIERYIW